jgi:hypothetical protein
MLGFVEMPTFCAFRNFDGITARNLNNEGPSTVARNKEGSLDLALNARIVFRQLTTGNVTVVRIETRSFFFFFFCLQIAYKFIHRLMWSYVDVGRNPEFRLSA